ncbi:hypothetical protein Tco_1154725 [Tanacetum coccineum]
MQEYMASHTEIIKRFEKAIFKKRDEINGRMAEMFGLLKELTSSTTPKNFLVKEEIRNPITKNVNAIFFCRIESEKVKENNEFIDKNIIEQKKRSIEELIRIANKEPLGEERKIIEPPEPQPVSHYLKHRINKELIEVLVENQRFNDSFLAMQLGKMECEDYHSLPKEPMRKLMLNKIDKERITKKKTKKTKPKRQNRTRNGKDCERQSQIKAGKSIKSKSQQKSQLVKVKVNPSQPRGTDNQEKDEKQSQNDKTGLGMEKTVKDKAKSKPESQSSQKVNRKVNWSKSKSTQVNPEAKVKEI